ncbi:MAG: AI-2E family transporter [Planctomycetales bacterium]|nr:AI-2E family transporter [Planctomycetales bacterium]
MSPRKSELTTIAGVAQLLAVVLTVATLYFARDVFIPMALGLLLSFLLSPIVNRLQRSGVNNIISVGATATLTFLILAGGFTIVGREVSKLVSELPQHKGELIAKARGLAGLTTGVGGSLDKLASEVTEAIEDTKAADKSKKKSTALKGWMDRVFPNDPSADKLGPNDGTTSKTPLFVQEVQTDLPLSTWATTAGTVLGPLGTAGLVSVFTLFLLIHREDLRDRIIAVVSHGNYVTTTEALDEAGGRISRYLIAQTIVNTSYGFVLAIGLAIIGGTMTADGIFPNAMLWGVLATCLRFVPYVGPVAAAIFPLVIAMSVFPGYSVFLAVLGLIVVMELLSNNVLEPWLYGASTGISAVAVIVAAVFWGWLWGPVGLLLSTPLTVCLVVLGRYVPRFKVISTLFGEQVEVKMSMRFYQRLLASDDHRARELLRQHVDANDLDATADAVLVPAFKRIRYDHNEEHLSDADENRLFALSGGMIADLQKHLQSSDTTEVESSADSNNLANDQPVDIPTVIGCAAHHISESLVLNLLRMGGEGSYRLQTVDVETLPTEICHQIVETDPAAVVIVVVPPGGFAQARFLCKSIREKGYDKPIIIACLGKFKNFDRLFVKARKAGVTSMTTSYTQTQAKVHSLIGCHSPNGK